MSFAVDLDQHLKARFPILYVETFEGSRAAAEIRRFLSSSESLRTPRVLYEWSVTTGLVGPNGKQSANTREPMEALQSAQLKEEAAVFVFHDLHSFLGDEMRPADPAFLRIIREISIDFKVSTHPKTLIVLAPKLVLPIEIEKEVSVLDFPLPTEEEITSSLTEMIDANQKSGRIEILIGPNEKERFAQAALGLTLSEAENAFARAMVNDGKLDISDIDVILEEKRQTIRKSGLLEFINSDLDLNDVGGLENLKRWLQRRNGSWREEARQFGLPAPKGVLVTGVPGCGKSLTAKGMAASWELPLLRLDIGKIFSGLVGSSEQNMRQAIRTAEALAPCVLWIDEIEKGFSGSGGEGDSGTSSRVFGSFLTWMQEKTSSVFVIATANNIDKLPPEFLRKGRFDEIFFVDLPTEDERGKIWEIQIGQRVTGAMHKHDVLLERKSISQLVLLSEGYSGAEIEQAVIAGLFEAFSEQRGLELRDLVRAIKTMVPLSVTQAEKIAAVRAWADVRAISASDGDSAGESLKSPKKPAEVAEKAASERGGRRVDF